tara:strand:+ start:267 stop:581 length:315 start_codon:yes stop_codon:yes gene_type:complete
MPAITQTAGRKGPRNKLRKPKGLKKLTPKIGTDKEEFYCVSCHGRVRVAFSDKNMSVKKGKKKNGNAYYMLRSDCKGKTCNQSLTRFISADAYAAYKKVGLKDQ